VPSNVIEDVREHYAPSDDPCFQLVPPSILGVLKHLFYNMGEPAVTRENIWDVYQTLRNKMEEYCLGPALNNHDLHSALIIQPDDTSIIPLTEGLRELRNGDAVVGHNGFFYMGGVDQGFVGDNQRVQDLEIGGGVSLEQKGQFNAENYPAAFMEEYEEEQEEDELAVFMKEVPAVVFSDDDNGDDDDAMEVETLLS
jgi:hypothetical protein